MKSINALTLVLLSGVAVTATAAGSDTLLSGKSVYGAPATDSQYAIKADLANSKQVNVRCGDTVTFNNAGKSFTWKFDTTTHRNVKLSKIAPAGFGGNNYTVNVSRNDMERGG